jgi:hypothetical protein
MVLHFCDLQAGTMHSVPVGGQSLGELHEIGGEPP